MEISNVTNLEIRKSEPQEGKEAEPDLDLKIQERERAQNMKAAKDEMAVPKKLAKVNTIKRYETQIVARSKKMDEGKSSGPVNIKSEERL